MKEKKAVFQCTVCKNPGSNAWDSLPWGTTVYEFKQSAVGGETQVFPHVRAGFASSVVEREESVRSDERGGYRKLLPCDKAITTSIVIYKEGRSIPDKGSLGYCL